MHDSGSDEPHFFSSSLFRGSSQNQSVFTVSTFFVPFQNFKKTYGVHHNHLVTWVRKSILKFDRYSYSPLLMQGFSNRLGLFQVILATPDLFSCVFGTCSLPTPPLKPPNNTPLPFQARWGSFYSFASSPRAQLLQRYGAGVGPGDSMWWVWSSGEPS